MTVHSLRTRLLMAFLAAWPVAATAQTMLTIPDTSGRRGDTLLIPVHLSGIGSDSLWSMQGTVTLSSSNVTIAGVTTAGTLSAGASASYFSTTRRVAIAMTAPVTSNGVLVYLQAILTGTPGQSTTIGLSSVMLNEGAPTASVDPGVTRLRKITIAPSYVANVAEGDSIQFTVSGDVVLPLTWSSSSDPVGTIDQDGMFRAVAPGFVTVRVSDGEEKQDSTTAFNVVPNVIKSLTLWIPDTSRTQTLEVAVPVRVTTVTGLGITSVQFRVTFNTSALQYLGLSTDGGLAASWGTPAVNDLSPGVLDIAWAGSDTLTGAGSLVWVRFRVKPTALGTSTIGLASATFNETITPALDPGSFTVIPAPLIKVNASALVALKGDSVTVPSVTGGTPPFAFSSSNTSIGTVDAGSGTLTVLTRGPVLIQAVDAQGFPGKSDTIRTYDFRAVVHDTSVLAGDSVVVPVSVGMTDGLGIVSFESRLPLDTSKVTFRAVVSGGTLTDGWSIDARDSAGTVRIAGAGATPLSGSGVLFGIRLAAKAGLAGPDSISVALADLRFNEPGSATPLALPVAGKLGLRVPNAPPAFTSVLGDTTVSAGSPFQFTYVAVDPNGDSIHYSIQQGPAFAMIDSLTGVLTLAAMLSDIGAHPIEVRASDGLLSTSTSAVVTVVAGNTASLRVDGAQDRARVLDTSPVNPLAVPTAYQISGSTITIESWVYLMGLPASGAEYQIVARGAQSSFGVDPWFSYALRVDNFGSAPRFNFWLSSGTPGDIFGATADTVTVSTGRWYHVAGTYDGTTARIYIDGELKKESASGGKLIGAGTVGFYIGGTTYGYFNGLIDEVRLWNTARTGPQIAGNKDGVLVGNEAGLAGYWPLDSAYQHIPSSQTLTPDATANHNDLVMQFQATMVPFPAGSTVQFAPTGLALSGPGDPTFTVTGADYRVKAVGDGWPKPGVVITTSPAGSIVMGDSIIWTPAAGQWGFHPVIATVTNSAGSLTDTVMVFVEGLRRAANQLALDVTNRGKAGAFSSYGKGMFYGGKNGLGGADFSLVDRNDARYAGGLYSTLTSFRMLSGFTDVAGRWTDFSSFATSFDDAWESPRIGVRITQTTSVKSSAPDDRYVINEYRVVNTSGMAVDDLFAQLTADFDVGVSTTNRGGYDSTLALSYAYEEGGATNSAYYGIVLLGRPVAGHAVFVNGTDPQYVRATNNLTTFPAAPASASDIRNQLTVGPLSIASGDSVTVAYAFVAADDLDQLRMVAQRARTIYAATAPTFASVTTLAVPGAEFRRRVSRNGTEPTMISAIALPSGASLIGDTLVWTPTDLQLGFRRVILEATNIAGTVRDTTDILVEAIRTAENQIRVDLTNRGKVGAFGQFGKGIWFKGKNGSGAADFSLVDRNSVKYAGGLYSTLFSFSPDGPATSSIGFIDTTSRIPGFTAFRTSFSDQWEPSATRIGVNVRMLGYVKATAPDDHYVIVEYNVINSSGGAIDDLFAQMTADFDIGNAVANLGGYDAALGLSYAHEQGGGADASFYGVALLSHPAAGHAVFLNGSDGQYVRSVANLTSFPAIPGTAGDTRNQLTAGPFALAAGDTLRFGVAFLAADDLTQLQAAALQARTVWGNFTTSVAQLDLAVPAEFEVAQNYPNPFNPATVIRFGLPTESRVSVTIYDQLGREMSTLVNGALSAGIHEVRWDAMGMASGLYFYRIEAVGTDGTRFVRTKKMVLMR